MSDLLTAICYELGQSTDLAALVDGRIHVTRIPERTDYPAVVVQRISRLRDQHQGGVSSSASARVQVGCWAEDQAVADQVRQAVEAVLDGLLTEGVPRAVGRTGASVVVTSVEQLESTDLFEFDDDGGEEGVNQIAVDYEFCYQP